MKKEMHFAVATLNIGSVSHQLCRGILATILLTALMLPSACHESKSNHPPSTPTIVLFPTSPTTSDNLICEITTPSIDPEGDEVTYSYQWYKDDELQSELTEDIISAEYTAIGETWRCVVIASDGITSSSSGSDGVTINLSPPTNLQVEAITSTQIDLTWDASADTSVVGYNVYRDSVLIATSSSTSASDSSLVPSTTYLYAVSAYDSHGHESEPSASIQVTTKSTSAPVISSISGTPSDGQTITLRGAGFGIHDLDLEWLGGAEGAIEQGNLGDVFSKEGWLVDPDSGGFSSSRYDDGQAHSGSEAIRSNIDSTPEQGKWGAGFKYDRGAPISSIYATWWVYTDPAEGEGGQWKMWRLQPYNNYVDCDGEIKSFHWYEENHDHSMFYVMITSDKDDYAQSYPNGNADLRWLDNDDGPNTKQWTRIELYAVESSSPGVRDGTFVYNIHKQTEPVKNLMNWEDDIMSRALGVEDRWQYFTFQNYWGNGNADNADFWIDDIYLQFGTRARVEIGDNPVWAECTHREVQNPTAWSEGSIDITLNQGSFEAGDEVYLFVIDEEGQASAGYPIVIA